MLVYFVKTGPDFAIFGKQGIELGTLRNSVHEYIGNMGISTVSAEMF